MIRSGSYSRWGPANGRGVDHKHWYSKRFLSRGCVEEGRGQKLQLLFDQSDLSDQLATVVAVYCGGSLLWLLGRLVTREVFSCKESVDFGFQEPHSFCQYMRFGG